MSRELKTCITCKYENMIEVKPMYYKFVRVEARKYKQVYVKAEYAHICEHEDGKKQFDLYINLLIKSKETVRKFLDGACPYWETISSYKKD